MSEGVVAIGSVTLGVESLSRSVPFYRDVWGLREVERRRDVAYLRATGPEPYVLALLEGGKRGFVDARLRCGSEVQLLAMHRSLSRAGVTGISSIEPENGPGKGNGFAVQDVEGRSLRLFYDEGVDPENSPQDDRPRKLAHVVLNAVDPQGSADFIQQKLGFRLSDQTAMMHFLRCSSDHHSIAFTKMGNTSLNHVAFEMPGWDGLMRGAGRLKAAGYPIQWGLGRHGPGNNVFAYFVDPDGIAIEYTAEVQQIDEATHRPGTPAEWNRPGNLDQWGYADPPAAAIVRAMHGDIH